MEKKMAAQYLKDFKCPYCGGETIKDFSEKAGYYYRCPACSKKFRAKEEPVIPDDEDMISEGNNEDMADDISADETEGSAIYNENERETENVAESSDEHGLREGNEILNPEEIRWKDVNIYAIIALLSAVFSPINPFGFIVTAILCIVAADKKNTSKRYTGCYKVALLIACMILAFKVIGCIALLKAAGGYIGMIKSLVALKATSPVGVATILSAGL